MRQGFHQERTRVVGDKGKKDKDKAQKQRKSFIDLYDHTHIEENVGEFLDYFVPRKVMVSRHEDAAPPSELEFLDDTDDDLAGFLELRRVRLVGDVT